MRWMITAIFMAFFCFGVAHAGLVDNGNGTVTDTATDLMWQKCSYGQAWTDGQCTGSPTTRTWQEAMEYAEGLNLGDHDDWRLPNRNELQSLVDYSRRNPAIDPMFAGVSSLYWSSTTDAYHTVSAWQVDFYSGNVGSYFKSYSNYVRAVRAGQSDNGSFGSLTVTSTGASSVPITASPSNYEGTTNYTHTDIPNGTQITLTAPATSGSASFSSWSGCDSTSTANRTCSVTINGDKTVTVNYSTSTGSLRVTIEPADARNAGAQWRRVGTNTWRSSGTTESNVPAGEQCVEFRDVSGWTTPGNVCVTLEAGQTATAAGTYRDSTEPEYYPFPDTGQTKCYDNSVEITCPQPGQPFYGQDAQYQPRLPRSYTKLGHGGTILADDALHVDEGGDWIMTRDNVTGLVWELKTNDNKDDKYNWQNAQDVFIARLNSDKFGSYDDWRLPTRSELVSLVNWGISNPYIDANYFPNIGSFWPFYWSSTTCAKDENRAWRFDFLHGYLLRSFKTYDSFVRAVRAEPPLSRSFINNYNGTVTDTTTGLMWQQETAPGTYTWEQALEYVKNLNLGDFDDWRLPNINELQTLIDDSTHSPAIDTNYFPNTNLSGYWSSSTAIIEKSGAWYLSFCETEGGIHYNSYDSKSNTYYVRAVRSGHSDIGSLICEALDNCDLDWSTGGDSEWFGQSEEHHYGGSAAQSGDITHNQQTWLETTVTGPGTISFWWKVSSEQNFDYLSFYIDGTRLERISGEAGWQQVSFEVPAGTNTLKWEYSKDGSVDRGADAGWVDYVRWDEEAVQFSLDVTRTGTGDGVINSTPSGISCGEECQALFYEDTELELTADPAEGSSFSGWGGDCSGETTPICNLVMNGNKTVSAEFTVSEHTIICEALDNCDLDWSTGGDSEWFGQSEEHHYGGSAAQSGDITHNQQTWLETTVTGPGTISFWWKISSEQNFDYLSFYIDGTLEQRISGEAGWQQVSFEVPAGKNTLKWVYSKDGSVDRGADAGWVDYVRWDEEAVKFSLDVTRTGSGDGVINSTPSGISCGEKCQALFYEDTEVELTADPAEGSSFSGWGGDCSGETTPVCNLVMNGNKSVSAEFTVSEDKHTVAVFAEPAQGGMVSGGGVYNRNAQVTVIATPIQGWTFRHWTEDGQIIPGAKATYSFQVAADRELVAHFREVRALPGVMMLLLDDEE